MAPPKGGHCHSASGSTKVAEKMIKKKGPSPAKKKSKEKEARLEKKKAEGPFICTKCAAVKGVRDTVRFTTKDKGKNHLKTHDAGEAELISEEDAAKRVEQGTLRMSP